MWFGMLTCNVVGDVDVYCSVMWCGMWTCNVWDVEV